MEKNSNETKKTMLMLVIGFYIIYMLIGASTPGLNYYLLAGPVAGVAVSLLTFCGWILMYNSLSRLEMSYNEPLFCVAQTFNNIYVDSCIHFKNHNWCDYSNGSVFNRIPEEEYQDFLNKMKN